MSDPLYRSRHDRMIAGVAGGLAERLGVDSSVVRIAWAILVLPTGFLAVLAYVVLALVVPDEDEVFRDPPLITTSRAWPASPPFPQQPPSGAPPTAAPQGAPSIGVQPTGSPGGHAPTAFVTPAAAPPPNHDQRRARQHAERAERRSRRPHAASFIVGGSLIVLGSWFLLREYLPALDMSRFWPLAVVGFGILLVLLALSQRSDDRRKDQR